MTQHTKGPWRVEAGVTVATDKGRVVCELAGWDGRSIAKAKAMDEAMEANARLIAAARDLLKACRAMLACCYDMERNDETVAAVKATMYAIAKATGETK